MVRALDLICLVLGPGHFDKEAARAAWVAYARCGDDKPSEFHGATLWTAKSSGSAIVAFAEHYSLSLYIYLICRLEFIRDDRGIYGPMCVRVGPARAREAGETREATRFS